MIKKIDKIYKSNTDCVVTEYYNDYKIIYSEKNDLFIRMGKKNEWLSANDIYITNYKKDIIINSPFSSGYRVYFIQMKGKFADELKNKKFPASGMEKYILNSIDNEYSVSGLSDELGVHMQKSLFEQLMVMFLRDNMKGTKIKKAKQRNEKIFVENIIAYLSDNLSENITFSDVQKNFGMSATGLKCVFKEYTGMGVMKYYNMLKIERAKVLIKEGKYNATQIAMILGYDSVHYFSRQFKSFVGVSPGQY